MRIPLTHIELSTCVLFGAVGYVSLYTVWEVYIQLHDMKLADLLCFIAVLQMIQAIRWIWDIAAKPDFNLNRKTKDTQP